MCQFSLRPLRSKALNLQGPFGIVRKTEAALARRPQVVNDPVSQCVNEKFNPVVKIRSFFLAVAGGFET